MYLLLMLTFLSFFHIINTDNFLWFQFCNVTSNKLIAVFYGVARLLLTKSKICDNFNNNWKSWQRKTRHTISSVWIRTHTHSQPYTRFLKAIPKYLYLVAIAKFVMRPFFISIHTRWCKWKLIFCFNWKNTKFFDRIEGKNEMKSFLPHEFVLKLH